MSKRVDGKVALVVGAGCIGPGWGNGNTAAVLYAREGAKVFAADINLEAAKETKAKIDEEGGECSAFAADVANSENVQAMVEKCIETYGRIDILHNNVGIPEVGGPEEISEENWDRSMNINTKGMFLTCKFTIPQMKKQQSGAIVNISSIASLRYLGYPSISYNAGKAAVNQITQNIAVQYASHGIRANCVLPGFMDTPLIEHYVQSGYSGDVDDMKRNRAEQVPMQRMGDAWDVAYAALYLASDEAKYVTGAQLVVDGGITSKFT
jgi:NAD(P)-dependent dehydrogenase (short-subunit alcohol dehydrogenase family)